MQYVNSKGGWYYNEASRTSVMAAASDQAPARMASAHFSAVISTGKFVLAHGTTGKIEASTTRSPSTARTRPAGSVTAIGSSSLPIRHVQEACHTPTAALRTNASSCSSSRSSPPA